MTGNRCSRMWQAEAVEDGRLSEADAASFERHAATCGTCAEMTRSLTELRAAGLRLSMPSHGELDHRRARHALLRRANELSVEPTAPHRHRYAWAAVLGLVAIVTFFVWQQSPSRVDHQPSATVPSFRLTPLGNARFRTLEQTATVRIAAESGHFEVNVTKLHYPQRFVIEVPDGEIEVQGTRFMLDVATDRTRSVYVSEGRVALRLRGEPPRLLTAGEQWSASTPPSAIELKKSAPAAASEPPARPAVIPTNAPHARVVASLRARHPTLPPSIASTTPGSDFTNAMSAFAAGDYGRAELLLAQFESINPADARTEDAAFLRAVSRARRGDATGARMLAAEYLRRYPGGLRRLEAEQLRGPE